MEYSKEALETMAAKIDLQDYASKTVDFVRHTGNTQYAECCFHNEKTASLAITPEIFHCFGCGKFGNIYTWLMLTEHLSFDQAVQKVADLTHSNISSYTESESMHFYKQLNRLAKIDKRVPINRKILDIEKDYRQKFIDEVPQEWLSEGISELIMKKYEIRIDPNSNRIVYPVFDSDFQLIGVKGRTRFKNYKDLKIMKYMNYQSLGGRLDYFQGMKQAEPYVKETDEIIILEGIKSVMKLDGWGYHNAVSAETSSINEYQVELLVKMHVKNVVIAFDKDIKLDKILACTYLLRKFTNCYVVIDKWKMLNDKDSPCDRGKDVWDKLYERRMRI